MKSGISKERIILHMMLNIPNTCGEIASLIVSLAIISHKKGLSVRITRMIPKMTPKMSPKMFGAEEKLPTNELK